MKKDTFCYNYINIFTIMIFVIVILLKYLSPLHARIIEPDNIIYGEIFNKEGQKITSGAEVTLEVKGKELDSYTMGEDQSAGDYYILRVPLDSQEPPSDDRAHTGDIATLKVNGLYVVAINNISINTIPIGGRGEIFRKDLIAEKCVLTNNGIEICDGTDNDCDGSIDEDFDLKADPDNCGSCGKVCSHYPHAASSCINGVCQIGVCENGWEDKDKNLINGCETEVVTVEVYSTSYGSITGFLTEENNRQKL